MASTLLNGLIAGYQMEGNSNDVLGVNNGTDTAMTYGTAYGKILQGANFNGTTSQITLSSTIQFDANDFTISMWFKTSADTTGIYQEIWASGYNGGGPDCEVNLYYNNIKCYARDGTGATANLSSTNILNDNQYHLMIFERIGSDFYLYIDNVLNDSVTSALGDIDSAGVLPAIGNGLSNTNNRFFNGCIDEVYIYNRALTQVEVTTLYNGGAGITYPFLPPATDNAPFFGCAF